MSGRDDLDVALAYSKGRANFMGLSLRIAPGALVPREETQLLGETAVGLLRARSASGAGLRAVDMCCGSGNLACGIARRLPDLRVWASDLTADAVRIARGNVDELGLAGRVQVLQGDLFAPLAGLGLEGEVDGIVCNPPYISRNRLAGELAGLLAHEPREAFDGGPYGLTIHQRVIREAPGFLRHGGFLAFEIGLAQERQVMLLFSRSPAFEAPTTRSDAQGNPRVVLAVRKKE
ncbi:MAG TPA: HemK/PrmC family methyltransferase [Myxococcales bacterium]